MLIFKKLQKIKKDEKKLINEENELKPKEKILFSKIFGLKEKEENNKVNIQEIKTEESSED